MVGERGADAGDEFADGEWFGEEGDGGVVGGVVAAHDDDAEVGVDDPEDVDDVFAAEVSEGAVDEGDVEGEGVLAERGGGLEAVFGGDDAEAEGGEDAVDGASDGGVVFDEEDPVGFGGGEFEAEPSVG